MFQPTVVQIGNSGGVILPKAVMNQLGITIGEKLNLEKHPTENVFLLGKGKHLTSFITPEFLRILERVNKQYKTALKTLAEK